MGGGQDLHVNGFTWLGRNCTIGRNCNFNGLRVSGFGHVVIGNNFHSGEECRIISTNHNYEGDALPYDTTNINRDVIIGDQVWLGYRVIVLPGTRIGEGVIIQAGSVVSGEIPPMSIAGGAPCKVFKYRNIEHYEELKQLGRFY